MQLRSFLKRMFRLGVIVTILMFAGQKIIAQEIIWKDTKNWRLYDLRHKKAFDLSIDSLRAYKSTTLATDIVHGFLSGIKVLPDSESGVWMGLFVATFVDEKDVLRKVIISNYGGFIYESLSKTYYELPEDSRTSWYDWLNEKSKLMMANTKQ